MEQSRFRFPLFIDVDGKRAVLIGGGSVAERRAAVLRRFGMKVTVVAPELRGAFPGAEHLARPYMPGDLAGAALAVAATDDRAVNAAVAAEARALRIPVSVADRPEECTFFFPAVCEGGDLIAGVVSRSGDHRAVAAAAQAVRRTLEGWK